jgi:hypothetical protein
MGDGCLGGANPPATAGIENKFPTVTTGSLNDNMCLSDMNPVSSHINKLYLHCGKLLSSW